MKNILLFTLCLLLSVMMIAIVPTEADAAIYEDTLRLHILAPSDSAEDQALKLLVRDKLLEKYSLTLAPLESRDVAYGMLAASIDSIESDCIGWVKEAGYDYSVKCEVATEWYNTREYESFTLPAGEYASLKITLGEGDGQNWWCVVYPPLCLDAAISDSGGKYTDEENALITKSGYCVKFKLLEVTSAILEGFSQ